MKTAGCYCSSLVGSRCDFCTGSRDYTTEVLRIMNGRFETARQADEPHAIFAVDGVMHRAILELLNERLGVKDTHATCTFVHRSGEDRGFVGLE